VAEAKLRRCAALVAAAVVAVVVVLVVADDHGAVPKVAAVAVRGNEEENAANGDDVDDTSGRRQCRTRVLNDRCDICSAVMARKSACLFGVRVGSVRKMCVIWHIHPNQQHCIHIQTSNITLFVVMGCASRLLRPGDDPVGMAWPGTVNLATKNAEHHF
jgi:hypothetical protein